MRFVGEPYHKNISSSSSLLSPTTSVLKETKDINVEAFNMIANKNEGKAMTEHI